jgi:molybdopterin biosynthesis enzyme
MGARFLFRPRAKGILTEPVETDPERTVFLRVSVDVSHRGRLVSLSGGQASNVLSALAGADAFAVVPVGTAGLPAGAEVELEMYCRPESRTAEEVLGWAG